MSFSSPVKKNILSCTLLIGMLLALCLTAFSQDRNITYADSVYNLSLKSSGDTSQILYILDHTSKIRRRKPKAGLILLEKVLPKAEKLSDKKWKGRCLNQQGVLYWAMGDFDVALKKHHEALDLYKATGSKAGQAVTFNNIANLLRDKGEYVDAVEMYINSLKLKEEINDQIGIISTLNNLANLHMVQGHDEQAGKLYNEAKVKAEKLKNPESLSMTYSNLANIYFNKNNFDEAYKYDSLALTYRIATNDKSGMAISYHNIATYFKHKHNLPKALDYIAKSLQIKMELGDKQGISTSMVEKGTIYLDMNATDSAIFYFEKALQISSAIFLKKKIAACYHNLAQAYYRKGNYEKAFFYQHHYSNLQDTLNSDDYNKVMGEMETKYDTEKKQKEIALLTKETQLKNLKIKEEKLLSEKRWHEIEILNKENLIVMYEKENREKEISRQKAEAEVKQKKINLLNKEKKINDLQIKSQQASIKMQQFINWIIICGLLIACIGTYLFYKRFQVTKKQNTIIEKQKIEVEKQRELADSRRIIAEEQKHIIEEKSKEITDSITYASRIQRAMLTSEKYISEHLGKEYFIFYQPKDIVSGDFYWAVHHNDYFYLATSDCTGHGVPGAFMSLLNISFLNENVLEKNISTPGKILDEQRASIIKALNPSGTENSKDGMDCVLTRYDFKRNELILSAANNPLWIVRKNELLEFKANKMPVGLSGQEDSPFSEDVIPFEQGDIIYTFTDGYADQFGGEKGKKFKYKQLKEILLEIAPLPMNEQKKILSECFRTWKGNLEQIDDVLIIGVRV